MWLESLSSQLNVSENVDGKYYAFLLATEVPLSKALNS